jgi:hypothetical protein
MEAACIGKRTGIAEILLGGPVLEMFRCIDSLDLDTGQGGEPGFPLVHGSILW